MLADLYNVPSTTEEMLRWSFSHQDAHIKINNAIFKKYGLELQTYILDPAPDFKSPEFETWLQNNQASHTDFDSVLGISGNDLSSLDVKQKDQVETWIRLHAFEHILAQQRLGYPD
jgi:hypothetical protein